MRGWLVPLAYGIGFHKPIAATAGRLASPARASSPPGDQGGIIEALMEGSLNTISIELAVGTPQSHFDVVCWRYFPEGAPSPSRPPPPPPAPLRALAVGGGSHVPSAPTRPSARRVWSADADDCGRPAFLLEPPSGHPLRPMGRHRTWTSRDAQFGCPAPPQRLGDPS